ncbi:asparagine synthase (glutamine-hydrolyzing) [Alteromonas sp. 14N.309.X.WAT.G.H12]|uniref:asparagine synthase (glutamine-hydrolyzing) n=1 Tax=Alteromonas sp. 14N.309.X.WAT.G.H12 TaxID=3120824 RepID=UPI002FCFA1E9
MCGFVAAVASEKAPLPNMGRVKAMQAAIAHRGPDSEGFLVEESVILGHHRLSVIDVDSAPQPERTIDGRFSMVYNGEIFNYKSLKEELVAQGVVFERRCDTELLLKAFLRYGPAVFSRLDGMFAAIIVDHQKELVWAVRDRVGVKPLYLAKEEGVWLFASEIQAIKAYAPSRFSSFNPEAIDNYMMLGYIVEPKTYIAGIHQLPPAHYAVYDMKSGEVKQHEYWSLKDVIHSTPSFISQSEGCNILEASIRDQLMSDVPLGTFLSGGLDSSLVTQVAASQMNGKRIHCYSAGFSVSDHDEIPAALEVAEKVNAHHTTLYFNESLLSRVGQVVDIYGGPFADNAALPTYDLALNAHDQVKVLLSGDGADELFFGYRNHRSMFIEQAVKAYLPSFINEHVLGWIANGYPNHPSMPRSLRAKSTFQSLSMPLCESYCYAMSIASRATLNQLYSHEFKCRLGAFSTEGEFARIGHELEHHNPMKVIQYLDFKTYLPGSVLTKVDRATMRAGVEARVPFLSNTMMDRVLPQEPQHNIDWRRNKKQLRHWAGKWLTDDVRNREKQSFTSPLSQWYRTVQYPELFRMIMTDELMESGIFDVRKVDALLREHHIGKADHGTTLWALSILARTLKH